MRYNHDKVLPGAPLLLTKPPVKSAIHFKNEPRAKFFITGGPTNARDGFVLRVEAASPPDLIGHGGTAKSREGDSDAPTTPNSLPLNMQTKRLKNNNLTIAISNI